MNRKFPEKNGDKIGKIGKRQNPIFGRAKKVETSERTQQIA
jgi:hypothetical protein